MRTFVKSLSAVVVAAVALFGCSAASSPKKTIPADLRVGINTGYPPLGFEKDGTVEGIEADFAHMLGQELGTKITFVPMPLNELIPAIEKDRIDVIMAGMSVTDKRAERVAFVESYARVGQMALIRKDDYLKLGEANAMNWPTSRVGVKAHTTGAKFAHTVLKHSIITEFETVDAGVAALRAGKVDFFIHDAPTVWRIAGTPMSPDPQLIGLYTPLTEEYLAWAVSKDATDLRQRLSDIVIEWKTNGKLKAVLDRWVPIRRVAADPAE
jgi:polar amino acid transport system substrate-binding protein